MEERQKWNPMIVVGIGIVLLFGLFIFLLVGNLSSKKEPINESVPSTPQEIANQDETYEEEEEESSSEMDTSKVIPPTIEVKRLEKYLNYRMESFPSGTNVMDDAKVRLEFVEYIFMELGESKTTVDTTMQPSAYTSKSSFENKYKELFGTNYTIGSEINNLISDCSYYASLNGTNSICWNNAWGSVGPTSFTIHSKTEENGELIYKGTFEKTKGREMLYHGTFEFRYTNFSSNMALKNVKINFE